MADEAQLPGAGDLRLERLARLQALTAELSAAATPQDVARIIFARGLSLVGARMVTLYLERAPGELELVHGLGVSEDYVQRYRRIAGHGALPSAEAYRTGRPVWLGSPEEMARRFPEAAAMARAEGDAAWAALPLVVDERTRGTIGLRFEAPRAFDEEEREFLAAVSRQCTQALERARLYEAQQRLAARLGSLQAITSELSAALTPREVAAVVLRHLLGLGARSGVILSLEAGGRLEPVFAHEADDLRDALLAAGGQSPAAEALSSGAPVWLEAGGALAAAYPALEPVRALRADGAWGAIPLRIEGRDVGVLVAAFPAGRAPGPEDRTFAVALAQQGAQALERARLYEAQRQQALRLGHLHTATVALSGAASAAEVAAAAGAALGPLGASCLELHALLGPDRLERLARQGEPSAADAGALAAEVVQTGRALWIESREELASRFPELAGGRPEESWAALPLLGGGTPGGALAIGFRAGRRLEADDRLFLRMLAMPCAQALERTRLTEAAAQERRAAEWLAALLEGAMAAVPVGMALLDADMRVIRTSERLARLSGLPQEAHRGRTLPELFPGFPGPALSEAFARAVASGERVDQEVSGETQAEAGVTRRLAVTWYPVRVAGRIVGAGMLVREAGR